MPKQNSESIVTFRVTNARQQSLTAYAVTTKVVDVRSPHQMSRKIVLDFLDGKLVYLDSAHKFARPTS